MRNDAKKSQWVLFILGASVFLTVFFVVNPATSDVPNQEIFQKYNGDERLLLSPIDGLDSALGFYIPDLKKVVVEIPFSEPVTLSGFSVFFPGNLHLVTSYMPQNFSVFYQNEVGDWILGNKVTGNSSNFFKFDLGKNVTVQAFRMDFEQASFEKTVFISDLRFYTRVRQTFFENIQNFYNEFHRGLLGYFGLSLLFFLLLLIPGNVLWDAYCKKFNMTLVPMIAFVFSPLISLCILLLLSSLFVLTGIYQFLYLYPALFVICLPVFLKRHLYRSFKPPAFLLLTVFLPLLIMITLQINRDFLFNLPYIEKYLSNYEFVPFEKGFFGYHADNTMPWGNARVFLNKVPIFSTAADKYRLGMTGFDFFNRTPVLPLILVPILKIFGESHFIYQLFMNVLVALFFGSMFLLIEKYFSDRVAKIVLVMSIMSAFLVFQVFNVEFFIKFFAMYPATLGIFFLAGKKGSKSWQNICAGFLFALSYLIHPIALFFIIPMFFVFFIRYKFTKKFFQVCVLVFFPLLVSFLSWEVFSRYYKNVHISDVESGTFQNIYEESVLKVEKGMLANKLSNFIIFFVPDFLQRSYNDPLLSLAYFKENFTRRSIVMALTPLLFLIAFLRVKKKDFVKEIWEPLFLGVGPFIVFLILFHTYSLGVYISFYPFSVPLLLAYIVAKVEHLFRDPQRIYVYMSYPFFMLAPFYYHSGLFTTMHHKSLVVGASYLAGIGIYLYLSFFLYTLVKSKK